MIKKEEKKEKGVRYVEKIGRRKTAIARVRLEKGKKEKMEKGKVFEKYFTLPRLQAVLRDPLEKLKLADVSVSAIVSGGGLSAQAEAVRLGISRALVEQNPDSRKRLRVLGYLTRDSRMVERKKYGFKKAGRAPQWAKR